MYLIITFGVGLGALNTGNNLLYLLLGLLLSLIVVSGVLSERCLRGLQLRRIGADAAFAGEPFAFRWEVERSRGTAFALSLSETDTPLRGEGRIAVLPPGAPCVVRADLVAPKRGKHALSAVRVTTTYPLGLFAKSREFDLAGHLLVYPRRRAAQRPPDPRGAPAGAERGRPRAGEGTGEVFGLTELREGDDARRIHWLKSASAGRWIRTVRAQEDRRSIILRVDPTLRPDALDHACEEVAAQARALFRQGHDVGLEAGAQRLRPASGLAQETRILRALAALGGEQPS